MPREAYQYGLVPNQNSFRVLELLPGGESDQITCLLHLVDWSNPPEYEAISYAWGNAKDLEVIICEGKEIKVTRNLHSGLCHLRYLDRSRILWADAICINQTDIPERSSQVTQMLKIYQTAKTVIVWLGPDSPENYAKYAIDSIQTIAAFLCQKVGISVSDLGSIGDLYQEVIFKNREFLPLPNECHFSNEYMWKALIWFYSHSYFTRVWAVQEINANNARVLHCGTATTDWDSVALVAGYIIMETAFSKRFGFTGAKCWFAAIMTTDRIRQPKNWLSMLYLTSNFASSDPRDQIYGLRGLMHLSGGAKLVAPDYGKSEVEVYRDSVEAGFIHFQNTDVLLYCTGFGTPSWIPRWDRPMLFRNPFRFGKSLPWKPAGETKPVWSIDGPTNVLSLSGFIVDHVKQSAMYDESLFGNASIRGDGKKDLKQIWQKILTTIDQSHIKRPFTAGILTAVADSLSFGLDDTSEPADDRLLLHNFIAYLKLVLDEKTYNKYIPADLTEDAKHANGLDFGKPVWDFTYPESSLFLTDSGLVGCCISTTEPGDIVFVAFGSKFPLVLRPAGGVHFLLRGFAYVHGIMYGEREVYDEQLVKIC
ncbi:hypothetical protein WAI453_007562 [Rhynchosporium graminicola]